MNSIMMAKASVVYKNISVLMVYNNHAVMEAANHSMNNPFWQSLYPMLEDVTCHYGFYGLVHDNTVVSLGDIAGTDAQPDIARRKPIKEHGGFLDACFTPQSKAGGKARASAVGCSIRIMTKRTIDIASNILSKLKVADSIKAKDWVVRCMGFCCWTSIDGVMMMMIDEWKEHCELNMPTVHVFSTAKVIVISVATGVVIRPVRTKIIDSSFINDGPYVDNVSVHCSDTMAFSNLKFPDMCAEPGQYFNIAILTIPFAAWTADPRLNLGVQMLRQAMSMSPINSDATMVPHGNIEPLVTTTFGNTVLKGCKDRAIVSMPGTHVVTAFINRYLNSEDACTISK